LAFATPPDPPWIAGIFDGADGDDIVTLFYETAATTAPALAPIGPLSSRPGAPIESIISRLSGSQFAQGPRAPPLIWSTVSAHVLTFLASHMPTASHTKRLLLAPRSPNPEFCPADSRLPDSVLGAPVAHEEHAMRAQYAALRWQESVKRYGEAARRDHGVNVQIRVGLNSGWRAPSKFTRSPERAR